MRSIFVFFRKYYIGNRITDDPKGEKCGMKRVLYK